MDLDPTLFIISEYHQYILGLKISLLPSVWLIVQYLTDATGDVLIVQCSLRINCFSVINGKLHIIPQIMNAYSFTT